MTRRKAMATFLACLILDLYVIIVWLIWAHVGVDVFWGIMLSFMGLAALNTTWLLWLSVQLSPMEKDMLAVNDLLKLFNETKLISDTVSLNHYELKKRDEYLSKKQWNRLIAANFVTLYGAVNKNEDATKQRLVDGSLVIIHKKELRRAGWEGNL